MRHTTRYLEDMPSPFERLLGDALMLGAPERARLAAKLIESLDEQPADADEVDAWAAEIERRRAEMASGAVRGLSVDEAMRAIRGEPPRDPR